MHGSMNVKLQSLHQFTNFNETYFEHCATRRHLNDTLLISNSEMEDV